MRMETVAVVNGVICEQNERFMKMYGRKKIFFPKSGKIVENHILTGKFVSYKERQRR